MITVGIYAFKSRLHPCGNAMDFPMHIEVLASIEHIYYSLMGIRKCFVCLRSCFFFYFENYLKKNRIVVLDFLSLDVLMELMFTI